MSNKQEVVRVLEDTYSFVISELHESSLKT